MTGSVRDQVMLRERMPWLQAPPLTVAEPILEQSALAMSHEAERQPRYRQEAGSGEISRKAVEHRQR
ncbi:hypothetical protein [Paenibacillus popilliae]|uniref:hypothetical protein n=1 Tax=Paenibacillus popilliae TaxID=78057 RepID=UPI0011D24680|nr:hypothetical protein [Paenibacillus popilliae]